MSSEIAGVTATVIGFLLAAFKAAYRFRTKRVANKVNKLVKLLQLATEANYTATGDNTITITAKRTPIGTVNVVIVSHNSSSPRVTEL